MASTPGMVISRATTGSSTASITSSASTAASSSPWKSSWRTKASTLRRSSGGRFCWPSQPRPVLPNRSVAGHDGTRLRAKMACTWFFNRVRCLTRWVRRAIWRRSIRVRSSGSHAAGRKSAANSRARIRASTLSVLTFASAMARVLRGLATTTRFTSGANSMAMASLLPVASNATSSSGVRVWADSRSASGVTPIRPSSRHDPREDCYLGKVPVNIQSNTSPH